jgi:hypothetical protein
MIFLAISGFVFIGAVAGYSQRQRQIDFSQGVRDFQGSLEEIINEVNSGSYQPLSSTGNFCHADIANNQPTFDTISTNSSGCVFLGKVISTGVNSSDYCSGGSSSCGQYSVFPLIARRDFYPPAPAGRRAVDNFAEAKPIGLTQKPSTYAGLIPDLTERKTATGSISITRIFVRNSSGNMSGGPIGAIGFMTSLNKLSAYGDNTKNVSMFWLNRAFSGNTESLTNGVIESLATTPSSDTTFVNPQYGVTFCLVGGSDQKAAITVGANGRRLDVVVQPSSSIDPGCP